MTSMHVQNALSFSTASLATCPNISPVMAGPIPSYTAGAISVIATTIVITALGTHITDANIGGTVLTVQVKCPAYPHWLCVVDIFIVILSLVAG